MLGSFDMFGDHIAYMCINNFYLLLLVYTDLFLCLFLDPEMLYFFRRSLTAALPITVKTRFAGKTCRLAGKCSFMNDGISQQWRGKS